MIAICRLGKTSLRIGFTTVIGGLVALNAASSAAAADRNVIDIHAAGFASATGHAVAKLLQPGDSISGRGYRQASAAIANGKAAFQFRDLPKGLYAVIVFHDENDNGTVDHGPLGFPSEALGFSNGFALSLISGLPTFDKLRFDYGGGRRRIDIEVK